MFNLNDVKNLCEEKISTATPHDWEKRSTHMERIEKEYLWKETTVDDTVDCLKINLRELFSFDDFAEEEDDNLSGIEEFLDSNWNLFSN